MSAPSAAAAATTATVDTTISPDTGILIPAIKYVYDSTRCEFREQPTFIFFRYTNPRRRKGGMRWCFKAEEVTIDEETGDSSVVHPPRVVVAKVFHENITNVVSKDYFEEAKAQCMCEDFAANYNSKADAVEEAEVVAAAVAKNNKNTNTTAKPSQQQQQQPPLRRVKFLACSVVKISPAEIVAARSRLKETLSALEAEYKGLKMAIAQKENEKTVLLFQHQQQQQHNGGQSSSSPSSLSPPFQHKFEMVSHAIASFEASKKSLKEAYAYAKNSLRILDYTAQDTGDCFFAMEPLMKGKFTKYNSNFGVVFEKEMDLNRQPASSGGKGSSDGHKHGGKDGDDDGGLAAWEAGGLTVHSRIMRGGGDAKPTGENNPKKKQKKREGDEESDISDDDEPNDLTADADGGEEGGADGDEQFALVRESEGEDSEAADDDDGGYYRTASGGGGEDDGGADAEAADNNGDADAGLLGWVWVAGKTSTNQEKKKNTDDDDNHKKKYGPKSIDATQGQAVAADDGGEAAEQQPPTAAAAATSSSASASSPSSPLSVIAPAAPQLSKEERDHLVFLSRLQTAEAFSHLSLFLSGHSFLVCDLQGVGDLYTDPQIHSEDGKGLGMGNMGAKGIAEWVKSHQCNDVCRRLGLHPLIEEEEEEEGDEDRQRPDSDTSNKNKSTNAPRSRGIGGFFKNIIRHRGTNHAHYHQRMRASLDRQFQQLSANKSNNSNNSNAARNGSAAGNGNEEGEGDGGVDILTRHAQREGESNEAFRRRIHNLPEEEQVQYAIARSLAFQGAQRRYKKDGSPAF